MKIRKNLGRGGALLMAATVAGMGLSAANNPDWMRALPDNAYVSTLSIPGAHDAVTAQLTSLQSFSTTQTLTIEQMMELGVRAYDLRPGVNDGRLMLYHGSAKSSRYMDEALKSFSSYLEAHPDEFFVFHLYPASSNNSNISALMNQYLADPAIAPHVQEFRPELTVGEMRGKMIFLVRDGFTWDSGVYGKLKWWNETDVDNNDPGSRLSRSDDSKEVFMWVQDKAHTDATTKKSYVVKAMEKSMAIPVPNRYNMTWTVNFTSAYSGVTSTSSGYKSVAEAVNPEIISYLGSHSGPMGLVMSDYITADGALVEAIIGNNFKYIDSYTPAVAFPRWRNSGLTESHGIQQFFQGNMEWVDLTSNGHYDLMAKGRDINNGWTPTFASLQNDGTALSSKMDHADPDKASWHRVLAPVDVNNDGAIDMVYGCSWGSKLRVNDGAGNLSQMTNSEGNDPFTLWGQEFELDNGNYQERRYQGLMYAADFDMNGWHDIITFMRDDNQNKGFPTIFYNHEGTGSFYSVEHNLPELRNGSMAIGDINGDGVPDVVVTGATVAGERKVAVCIKRNAGEGNFMFDVSYPAALQEYATTNGSIALGDLTGDGAPDIFISGEVSGDKPSANIFHNDGAGNFTCVATELIPTKFGGSDLMDVNSDGLLDVVYAGETDRWEGATTTVVINQGDGRYFADGFSMNGHRSGAAVRACDYNHNGLAAVAVMGYAGSCFEIYEQEESAYAGKVRGSALLENGYQIPDVNYSIEYEQPSTPNTVELKWEKINDGIPYRYNYVVTTKNGTIYSSVPVNPAKGAQLMANSSNATYGNHVALNIDPSELKEWGVYAIAPNGQTGRIATPSNVTGIESVAVGADADDEAAEYYNLQGLRIIHPQGGIFIRRTCAGATKVYIP